MKACAMILPVALALAAAAGRADGAAVSVNGTKAAALQLAVPPSASRSPALESFLQARPRFTQRVNGSYDFCPSPGTIPFCQCRNNEFGFLLTCDVEVPGVGSGLTMVAELDGCSTPAFFSYSFLVLGKPVAKGGLKAGEKTDVPIPGLSIVTPVGSVGVVAAVQISGNIDDIRLKVGIDACGDLPWPIGAVCASYYFPSTLPVNVIDLDLELGNTCGKPGPSPPSPSPPSPGPPPPANAYYFGNPYYNECLSNERALQFEGIPGAFCAPACGSAAKGTACGQRAPLPPGTQAVGDCLPMDSPKYCGLICEHTRQCPIGASCKAVANFGLCTYDTVEAGGQGAQDVARGTLTLTPLL